MRVLPQARGPEPGGLADEIGIDRTYCGSVDAPNAMWVDRTRSPHRKGARGRAVEAAEDGEAAAVCGLVHVNHHLDLHAPAMWRCASALPSSPLIAADRRITLRQSALTRERSPDKASDIRTVLLLALKETKTCGLRRNDFRTCLKILLGGAARKRFWSFGISRSIYSYHSVGQS